MASLVERIRDVVGQAIDENTLNSLSDFEVFLSIFHAHLPRTLHRSKKRAGSLTEASTRELSRKVMVDIMELREEERRNYKQLKELVRTRVRLGLEIGFGLRSQTRSARKRNLSSRPRPQHF
eukprot:1358911-Amorphochlora_amoeboformis.AAC.1